MLVHPHNPALLKVFEARFHARGERDAQAYAKAYAACEGIIWDTPASLLVRIQAATGVKLHLLHMKTRRMIKIVRDAKAAGQQITTEVNPVCLLIANDWANVERLGPYSLSTYIGDGQSEPLWDAFRDGTIDVIGVAVEGERAAVQVFPLRDGRMVDRYSFHLDNAAGEGVGKIDDRPAEVFGAERIDEHADSEAGTSEVVVAVFVEDHPVLHARARSGVGRC